MSEVPLGAFLSGGVDSSSVVAMMPGRFGGPVITSSIGFEEKDFNELPYAREIASHFSTDHHEQIVRPDAVTDGREIRLALRRAVCRFFGRTDLLCF